MIMETETIATTTPPLILSMKRSLIVPAAHPSLVTWAILSCRNQLTSMESFFRRRRLYSTIMLATTGTHAVAMRPAEDVMKLSGLKGNTSSAK